MKNKKRFISSKYYLEVDILKGLGILLVVLGHLSYKNESINHLIFSFHMPLFFILSGFVFKRKEQKVFLKNKSKRILIPYIFFSLISFVAYYTLNYEKSIFELKDFIVGTLLGVSNDFYLSWNVVLWFLPSIFLVNIIFNGIPKKIEFSVLIFWALGLISIYYIDTVLPFHLKSTLLAIPFFYSGILLKKNYHFIKTLFFQNYSLIKCILILAIGLSLAFLNKETPDLRLSQIGNPFLFYIAAFLITFSLLGLSRKINNSWIVWLGVNSLAIMGLHLKFRFLGIQMISFLPISYGSLVSNLLITFFIIALLIMPLFILKRYLPQLVGKN